MPTSNSEFYYIVVWYEESSLETDRSAAVKPEYLLYTLSDYG